MRHLKNLQEQIQSLYAVLSASSQAVKCIVSENRADRLETRSTAAKHQSGVQIDYILLTSEVTKSIL